MEEVSDFEVISATNYLKDMSLNFCIHLGLLGSQLAEFAGNLLFYALMYNFAREYALQYNLCWLIETRHVSLKSIYTELWVRNFAECVHLQFSPNGYLVHLNTINNYRQSKGKPAVSLDNVNDWLLEKIGGFTK